MFRIFCDRFQIFELFADFESVFYIGVSLVADAFVFVELKIVDAPVIRAQCGYEPCLLRSLLLFFKQFFLKFEPVFKFVLFDIGRLFFDQKFRVLFLLENYECENDHQEERG